MVVPDGTREAGSALMRLRDEILTMSSRGSEGHVPSSLSILELVWAVYANKHVYEGGKNRFVLSKGHGCLALYVVLAHHNYFPKEWLDSFGNRNSPLGGHPDSTRVPGVEASTGSLGHGFPFSVGLAFAEGRRSDAGRVFTLIGDGEANEGSVWEAALLATQHRLSNLVCLVDDNGSSKRALAMEGFSEKFKSFGWNVTEVDGHNLDEIQSALELRFHGPHAVIAKTIKGHGVAEMESNPAWHHRTITSEDLERFRSELH